MMVFVNSWLTLIYNTNFHCRNYTDHLKASSEGHFAYNDGYQSQNYLLFVSHKYSLTVLNWLAKSFFSSLLLRGCQAGPRPDRAMQTPNQHHLEASLICHAIIPPKLPPLSPNQGLQNFPPDRYQPSARTFKGLLELPISVTLYCKLGTTNPARPKAAQYMLSCGLVFLSLWVILDYLTGLCGQLNIICDYKPRHCIVSTHAHFGPLKAYVQPTCLTFLSPEKRLTSFYTSTSFPSAQVLNDKHIEITGELIFGKTRTKDKYRVVYSDHQRLELEKEFHYSRYITIRRKSELATMLGLSERQVKIWFQNRRAKERKQMKKRDELLQKEKLESVGYHPSVTAVPPMPHMHHHPHPHVSNAQHLGPPTKPIMMDIKPVIQVD
ncbi:unnamed protein product, partial [Meganyctiphanes norvegica]